MEVITKPFFSVYNLFDRMKTNDEQFPHISSRLNALQELVVFVQEKEPDQLSDNVNEALKKLATILESAKEMLDKFSKIHENVLAHMVKAGDYKAEFEKLNKSLTDGFVTLSGALHVHQDNKLSEQENMLAEQEKKLTEQERKLHEQENKLAEQRKMLAEQEKKQVQQEKLVEQENMLAEQKKKLDEQENKLAEQEKKQVKQEKKQVEQENMLAEQENKLHEQEMKLTKQERKLAEQEDKLAEQEDLLLRVESKLAYESRAYYCVLQ